MKIHYNPKLKQLSRDLRNHSTLSEVLLWNKIKRRQMKGYMFMRQKPIGNFIADFYCSPLKLVIEIDGQSHEVKEKEDTEKQNYLESLGLYVVRFGDLEVKRNMDNVLRTIECWIEEYEENNKNSPLLKGNARRL